MKTPPVDGEIWRSVGTTSDPRASVLLAILLLGQAQIEQGNFVETEGVFAELDELDRQEGISGGPRGH